MNCGGKRTGIVSGAPFRKGRDAGLGSREDGPRGRGPSQSTETQCDLGGSAASPTGSVVGLDAVKVDPDRFLRKPVE